MSSTIHLARTGQLPPLKRDLVGPCRCKCPGGHPCECNGQTPHHLHICKHEKCWCHSQQRYERKKDHE